MHELSITEQILSIILKEVEKHNVKRVNTIKLKMGEMSDILPEYINYYFNIISKGTAAEGALIQVQRLPIVVLCCECGRSSRIDIRSFRCPICKSQSLKITSGNEFYIDSMEAD